MKSFFGAVTALSLRFRWLTLIVAAAISVAGLYAITQLRQELIPSVSFPQTIILSQVSGMTSDQVLTVLTERIEQTLSEQVPEIVNIESTTTGTFGAVVTARNDFGLDQDRLQADIQAALDTIWLPTREIAAPEGEAPDAFAARLLADVPADLLIYLQERDSNFLFQLTPDVWAAFSPDTVTEVVQYLAAQTQEQTGTGGALRQLIDQEIAPLLDNLPDVASVSVGGGQLLPGEGDGEVVQTEATPTSLLLKLSPEVWAVVSDLVGYEGERDQAAVEAFTTPDVAIPTEAPALPESWQMDRFVDATDLAEMRTLTRSIGAVFNDFQRSGRIIGSLGQTNDLTPEVITDVLAIEPTLVDAFKAEHLAAMSPDVFAALPEEFIAGLDGLTRDQLAARGLAAAITGAQAEPEPVDLPSPWRISPPQIIAFSLDDLPLASFAISGTVNGTTVAPTPDAVAQSATETPATPTPAPTPTPALEPGPALPLPFSLIGTFLGIELNSADDLVNITLPDNLSEQFGASNLSGAQLLSFLFLLSDTDALPEGVAAPSIPIDPAGLIGLISADAIAYLAENDPTFTANLSAEVFNAFSDDVLALDVIAPPLDSVWNTLAGQPQFATAPLRTAADIVALGDGVPSVALNAINAGVPAQFAGYEVRLFNSLSPATLRYFALREPDFFTSLDTDALLKLSPETIAALPPEVLASLPEDTAAQLTAIATGETPSAAEALASLYQTDVAPGDPNAPALNPDWATIGDFIGVELNSADDFSRFFQSTTGFLNELFDSPAGAGFAPRLFGGLSPEALAYMAAQDATLADNLRVEALRLLPADTLAVLPPQAAERMVSGAAPFEPTDNITRINGASSLLVTIYKADTANTVEAFHNAERALNEFVEARGGDLQVTVSFEQASFIEESISGVAREGGLGAIFAIIVILVFLSSGFWSRQARLIVGAVLAIGFAVILIGLVAANAGALGGDFGAGWDGTDVLVRAMLVLGIIAGLFVMLWPGRVARPAWRSTLVTAISIPLSILMAFMLMYWLPPSVHNVLAPAADGSPLLSFLLRLFPASITINIMTLSGFTVAIGRVVDDSIVVLENIFRHVGEGGDKRTAIIEGAREVSVAIFAATIITVVVFLPLGLTGGIIGEFFLPFGLAVTYALMASFVVAITVVPVLAYLLLDQKEMSAEGHEGRLERIYRPALNWALSARSHQFGVLGVAFASLVIGGLLLTTLPTAFLPSFGEPQITVSVSMPAGTDILTTNDLVVQFEDALAAGLPEGEVKSVQSIVGGGGLNLQALFTGGSSVDGTLANITVAVENPGQLDQVTGEVRTIAEGIFGPEHVTVSAASLSEQGFGGFALVLAGPQSDLEAVNQQVIDTLNAVDGLANVSSNLAGIAGTGGGEDAPVTFIRIDGESAVRFTGELETNDTLGVTAAAKDAVMTMPGLPETISVSEGFESSLQTEGFASLFVAMGIAIVIVIVILMITFGSLVHWIDIMLSVVVAPVGAAVALALTNRVLGISALIGMLMLIGIVVTNAVVLIDRVRSNQYQRGMDTEAALKEAGNRRLRPILMTAIATICALIPLAIGLSQGAIIAAELGTVVIGGLFTSTLLTLIVVPVAYKMLDPLDRWTRRLFRRG
jgi:multidrug efflux pump subunit AcrB